MKLATGRAVILFAFIILCGHVVGMWYLLYGMVWWIDIVLHTLGGAWVAAVFFYLKNSYAFGMERKMPRWWYIALMLGFVMLIGVLWEWLEYCFDVFFATPRALMRAQLGLPDTMGDLLADFIGGLVLGLYIMKSELRRKYA